MKLLIEPSTKEYQSYINCFSDGFIVGLQNFCNGFKITHTVPEIRKLKEDYPDKEIFVSMNIPIYDEMFEDVKEKLKELDSIKVTGVLFYDLAILQIKQELSLDIDLVWNQTHMVTNSRTCNYYHSQGVKYAYLANEITLSEMLEIKKNTKISCMAFLLGYPIAALSKRKLVSNYYQFLEKNKKNPLVIREPISHQEYTLHEDNIGTVFYYNKILNGARPYLELLENDFDYGVLREDINHDTFLEVLNEFSFMRQNFNKLDEVEKDRWISHIGELICSRNTGFFYRKTIFKVKKK